jgi:uncharacterized protein (TIGR02145 family)
MRSLVNVLVFSLGFGVVHAQSKKEMIVLLNSRVDSLSQVVANERSENTRLTTKIGQLEAAIKRLENEKSALDVNLEAQRKLKDAQIKSKQDSLALVVKELFQYKPAPPKVEEKLIVAQDVSGPIKTVTIGKQVWMLENLNVATFKNGVAIPEATYDEPKSGWWDRDCSNCEKLYNWYAVVDTNGLCPQGWHVPSDAEWDILVMYLGGWDVAGKKLKAKPIIKKIVEYYDTGGVYERKGCNNCSQASSEYKKICPVCKGIGIVTTNKYIPKRKVKYNKEVVIAGWDGTNESGFTGLQSGYYYSNDGMTFGSGGHWWSSTDRPYNDVGGGLSLFYNRNVAERYYGHKRDGLSVRCLRD